MLIHELVHAFASERNYTPDSVNQLLDFYQHKYILEEIDIKNYRRIFDCLHKQGAISAHEYEQLEKSL
ncbi:hypothetical protein CWR48_11740 [Oceanobacillus arenosus]|uniref:Uncharacterized protein n=1 Tax=Oceanobacillus arenosus TaxID=1229153 RepID=A0A3D8PQ47_9BACI|nr:YppF family protein [Oceanobacillus arenosus]RDW18250.1 hypothetical protein CWR48_11740 [Oceanobacillus arenosus]